MRDNTPAVPSALHELMLAWFGMSASASAAVNDAALLAALAVAPVGGRLISPPDLINFSKPTVLTKPVTLVGHGPGPVGGTKPTVWKYAQGVSGMVVSSLAGKSVVRDMAFLSPSNASGSAVGVTVRGRAATLDNLSAEGFGGHGVSFDAAARAISAATESGGVATLTVGAHTFVAGESVAVAGCSPSAYNGTKTITAVTATAIKYVITPATGNATVLGTATVGSANASRGSSITSYGNGLDGIHIEGADANVVHLYCPDCRSNLGYGIATLGDKGTIVGPHTSSNALGDFYDGGKSNSWINPYSEGSGKFVIDAASGKSTGGYLLMTQPYAPPVVWSGDPPILGATGAVTRAWRIVDGISTVGRMNIADPVTGDLYRFDVTGGVLSIRSVTPNLAPLTLSQAGDRITLGEGTNLAFGTATGTKIGRLATNKLAFWGATPVVQPVANPDTSGATLAQLETEVNELKAMLRTIGLMAP